MKCNKIKFVNKDVCYFIDSLKLTAGLKSVLVVSRRCDITILDVPAANQQQSWCQVKVSHWPCDV